MNNLFSAGDLGQKCSQRVHPENRNLLPETLKPCRGAAKLGAPRRSDLVGPELSRPILFPVKLSVLAAAAKNGPEPGKSGTSHQEQTAQAGHRILIIEDDPFSLELYTILLEASGYTILTARDGEQGLAVARREQPDLIVCDVVLPKMGGCEVVRYLKADPVLRRVPIIAVTALDDRADRDRLLAAGFDGYIAKPIEAEVFVEQIEDFYDRVKNPSN